MNNNRAFTLIEIMIWILIISFVILWWFQALSAVTIWKARLIQRTDIQKESFYFTEKLFEMIKKWGVIDYEEYFNRKVIWNTSYIWWHFDSESWFGNFWRNWNVWTSNYWDSFYYCRSWDNSSDIMSWSWCYNNTLNSESIDFDWIHQRYWEYFLQFIDYNSNHDNDNSILWDEDWDWNIIWDYDDEYIWLWPVIYTSWDDLKELYLISWDLKRRTLLRWNVKLDPFAWTNTCDIDTVTNQITWEWCLWTIEYLILDWKDYGMDHINNSSDDTEYDWVIDTWLINKDFTWWIEVVAWENNENYWLPLFPDSINISEFNVFLYPNQNINYSWRSNDIEANISPYVDLKIKLKPSWKSRRKIRWDLLELDFSMTISLNEIYSK